MNILGISGSLRAGSYNTALLHAAAAAAPVGMVIECYDRLRDLPPYDQDSDIDPPPEPVADLRRRIRAADGCSSLPPSTTTASPGC
jgi:chromate reductase, NAD(P)H dehydrogenase (quinone)